MLELVCNYRFLISTAEVSQHGEVQGDLSNQCSTDFDHAY